MRAGGLRAPERQRLGVVGLQRLGVARLAVAAWMLLTTFGINSAAAQRMLQETSAPSEATSPAGQDDFEQNVAERNAVLTSQLCDLQRPARIYSYSWLAGLSVLLIVQGTLALTVDADDEAGRAARTGYVLGASMTGLGLGLIGLTSRPETNSCDVMRAYPTSSSSERMARVQEGERRLRRAGKAAERQTAWWMHGLGILLGTGVGLGLGFGYSDNVLRATAQGVGTFAFTELRIWTRPTRAIGYAERL